MKPSNASIASTVRFPLEEKPFVELQTELTGRELHDIEEDIAREYMQIVNGYYEDGKNGDEWESIIERAKRCLGDKVDEYFDHPDVIHFLTVVDHWCQLAFKRGREFAGLEAE